MNHIKMYIHCKRCFEEARGVSSPADYQQIEAGWTDRGLQIWCKRHDQNILHIDFQGAKHPGDTHGGDFE